MDGYLEFINEKTLLPENSGFDVSRDDLNPMMFDFQKDIVRWSLKKRQKCNICRLWIR